MEKRFQEVPIISICKNTCKSCGLCSRICPTQVLKGENIDHPEECVLCGQCLCVCPTGSIEHSGFLNRYFSRIKDHNPVSAGKAFEFLSQRRSVRNYTKEMPSREVLEKLVQIAGFAPGSPHHRIGWVRSMTIVYGEENMKVVLDTTADYMRQLLKLLNSNFLKVAAKFSELAKAGLAVVPDMEMRLSDYSNGSDSIIYKAPAAIFFHAPVFSSTPQTDCDNAMFLVQLYAQALGLGTCWNGLMQGAAAGDHLRSFKTLSDFLNIPSNHRCYAAMTIGYSSVKLHSIPERKVGVTWIAHD